MTSLISTDDISRLLININIFNNTPDYRLPCTMTYKYVVSESFSHPGNFGIVPRITLNQSVCNLIGSNLEIKSNQEPVNQNQIESADAVKKKSASRRCRSSSIKKKCVFTTSEKWILHLRHTICFTEYHRMWKQSAVWWLAAFSGCMSRTSRSWLLSALLFRCPSSIFAAAALLL